MKFKKKNKTRIGKNVREKGLLQQLRVSGHVNCYTFSKEQLGKRYQRIKTVNLPCNLITKALLFKKIIKMYLKIYNKDVHHFLIRLFIINQSEEI